MSEEKPQKSDYIVGAILYAGIAAGSAYFKHGEKKYWERVLRERGPGIARKGEKVTAIEDYDGSGIYENISKGQVFTVKAYDLAQDTYQFVGYERCYNPYLGEYTGQWYPSGCFQKIDDDA